MSTVSPQETNSKNYLSDLKAYELDNGLTASPQASSTASSLMASDDDYFTTTTTKVMINSGDDLTMYASTSSDVSSITSANEIKLMDHSKIIRHLSSIDPLTSSSSSSSSTTTTTTVDEETTQQQMAPNRRTLTNPMPETKKKKMGDDGLLEDECDAFSQNKCEPRSLHITCG